MTWTQQPSNMLLLAESLCSIFAFSEDRKVTCHWKRPFNSRCKIISSNRGMLTCEIQYLNWTGVKRTSSKQQALCHLSFPSPVGLFPSASGRTEGVNVFVRVDSRTHRAQSVCVHRTEWPQQAQNSWQEDRRNDTDSIFICHSLALYLISAPLFTSRFSYAPVLLLVQFQSSFLTCAWLFCKRTIQFGDVNRAETIY